MKYKDSVQCSGATIELFINDPYTSFEIDSTKQKFQNIVPNIIHANGQSISSNILKESDFTIVNQWNTSFAPKMWFRDQKNWIDEAIQNQNQYKFQFLKINSDYLVENGFKKGSKGKYKRIIDKHRVLTLELIEEPALKK